MVTALTHRLAFILGAFGVAVLVSLATARAAEAWPQCGNYQNSSPCYYTFASPGSNSPNLFEQPDAIPLDVYPVNYSCFTGYWFTSSSTWAKGAPGEQCGQNFAAVQLLNTARPGQLEHVMDNVSTSWPNPDVYIYF